jgi:hypothetical protein
VKLSMKSSVLSKLVHGLVQSGERNSLPFLILCSVIVWLDDKTLFGRVLYLILTLASISLLVLPRASSPISGLPKIKVAAIAVGIGIALAIQNLAGLLILPLALALIAIRGSNTKLCAIMPAIALAVTLLWLRSTFLWHVPEQIVWVTLGKAIGGIRPEYTNRFPTDGVFVTAVCFLMGCFQNVVARRIRILISLGLFTSAGLIVLPTELVVYYLLLLSILGYPEEPLTKARSPRIAVASSVTAVELV